MRTKIKIFFTTVTIILSIYLIYVLKDSPTNNKYVTIIIILVSIFYIKELIELIKEYKNKDKK